MHVCLYVCVYLCVFAHTHIYIYIYIYLSIYLFIYTYIHTYIHTYTYDVYIYIYVDIHTHTHFWYTFHVLIWFSFSTPALCEVWGVMQACETSNYCALAVQLSTEHLAVRGPTARHAANHRQFHLPDY